MRRSGCSPTPRSRSHSGGHSVRRTACQNAKTSTTTTAIDMGKRKLESDDDDEWAVSLPKASGSIKKGGPSRTGTNATHVKKEPRDHDLNYLATSSVAGSSSSLSSGHVSKNRVKKEALDEDNVGLPGPSSASAPQASTLDAPVKTEDPIPAVPHRSQKRKKKAADSEAPVEKRLARVRTSCPKVSSTITLLVAR